MPTTEHAFEQRAYRRRIATAGEKEVWLRLSNETISLIDEIKERHGLRNRGQVIEHEISARELLKLFEQRRQANQEK